MVMVQATSAELVPEHLSGQLVVPTLGAKASVGQLAYEALRKAILAMDIYHSDADLRLDEKTLAAGLGVSRTPVREALEARDSELAERLVRDHALNLADHVEHTVDHLD